MVVDGLSTEGRESLTVVSEMCDKMIKLLPQRFMTQMREDNQLVTYLAITGPEYNALSALLKVLNSTVKGGLDALPPVVAN